MSNKLNTMAGLLLAFLIISANTTAMTPDPIFEYLTSITARCHIAGDSPDAENIEKVACKQIESLLRQRFGDSMEIKHLLFSDPAILDTNRLLVVLSGRIETAEEIKAATGRQRYLSLTLSVSRGGKGNSLMPAAPRVVALPLEPVTGKAIIDLVGPPVEKLCRENGI